IKSDFVDAIEAVLQEKLGETTVDISSDPTCCVVLAAKNYPGTPVAGTPIEGLDADGQLKDAEGVQIFHGGTSRLKDGRIVTSGGRVLGVTASAATLPLAVNRAYQAVERIRFDGMQFRRDIAA